TLCGGPVIGELRTATMRYVRQLAAKPNATATISKMIVLVFTYRSVDAHTKEVNENHASSKRNTRRAVQCCEQGIDRNADDIAARSRCTCVLHAARNATLEIAT